MVDEVVVLATTRYKDNRGFFVESYPAIVGAKLHTTFKQDNLSFSKRGVVRGLWIPAGFAHGFEALQDSYVHYKCSSIYNGSYEGSINIFDEQINIPLKVDKNEMIISKRDEEAISFKEYSLEPKFFKEQQ